MNRGKPLITVDAFTDEIRRYESSSALAKELGSPTSNIVRSMKNGYSFNDVYIFYEDDTERNSIHESVVDSYNERKKKTGRGMYRYRDYIRAYKLVTDYLNSQS